MTPCGVVAIRLKQRSKMGGATASEQNMLIYQQVTWSTSFECGIIPHSHHDYYHDDALATYSKLHGYDKNREYLVPGEGGGDNLDRVHFGLLSFWKGSLRVFVTPSFPSKPFPFTYYEKMGTFHNCLHLHKVDLLEIMTSVI